MEETTGIKTGTLQTFMQYCSSLFSLLNVAKVAGSISQVSKIHIGISAQTHII